jgi:hypothetical protein|tara:strand:- start:1104 stop:1574 length:471 start_codon:yes stop_codon:yes gene_type:complete
MLTLLGSLLGFGTSIVPEVLGFFKQSQANKQELKMLEAKAQYAAQLSTLKLQELDAEADIAETKGLYAHDTELARRGGWVVGLQASVRPVVTYLFMAAFLGVKGGLVFSLIFMQGVDWTTALDVTWDGETQALFAAIMSFWFGNRAMSKARAVLKK